MAFRSPLKNYYILFFFILFLLSLISPVFSQEEEAVEENLDDLFQEAPEDIILEETEADYLSQFEESEKVSLKGFFSAKGGVAIGWDKEPDFSDPSDGLGPAFGAETLAKVSFDARPDSTLRIFGSLYTEIDPAEGHNSWTDPAVEELFADYNWLDKAFFRIGKHIVTWGQGRIFTPGNLVEESEDGVTVKASLPTLLDGVSFVSFYDEDFSDPEEKISGEDLAYGMLADKVFGQVRLSAGARFRQEEGLTTVNSFKTVIMGTDLLSDLVVHFEEDEAPLYEVLGGFFREWADFRLYGEYYFDGSEKNYNDHNIGLAAAYKNIFNSPLDFGVEWQHTFLDDSGSLITGVKWSPWKNIKASVGIPFIYGGDDSRYVEDNDSPIDQRLSCAFFLELSSSF